LWSTPIRKWGNSPLTRGMGGFNHAKPPVSRSGQAQRNCGALGMTAGGLGGFARLTRPPRRAGRRAAKKYWSTYHRQADGKGKIPLLCAFPALRAILFSFLLAKAPRRKGRPSLFWKRISYLNVMSLISCFLSLASLYFVPGTWYFVQFSHYFYF
jgi:hypothetical protein